MDDKSNIFTRSSAAKMKQNQGDAVASNNTDVYDDAFGSSHLSNSVSKFSSVSNTMQKEANLGDSLQKVSRD